MRVLFSKPINLSQKLRINDVSLLHWETGEKRQWQRGKRRKLQLWCGCCCCILYTVPNTVKGRLQPSDCLDEGETPICQYYPSLMALQLPCFQPAKVSCQRCCLWLLSCRAWPKGGLLLPGFNQTPQQNSYYHCEISSPPSQWSPKWGAHTPGTAQHKSLECRKKIFF